MGTKLEGETMTRQETIEILQDMLNIANGTSDCDKALEKAIEVLKQMSDDEYEYLTFEIKS